jgi:hypothetical protein
VLRNSTPSPTDHLHPDAHSQNIRHSVVSAIIHAEHVQIFFSCTLSGMANPSYTALSLAIAHLKIDQPRTPSQNATTCECIEGFAMLARYGIALVDSQLLDHVGRRSVCSLSRIERTFTDLFASQANATTRIHYSPYESFLDCLPLHSCCIHYFRSSQWYH